MRLHLLVLISRGTLALTAPSQTNPALSLITPPPPNLYTHTLVGGGTPTTSPNEAWIEGELKKRQQQIQVCGYLNGQSAYPYYCEAGTVCTTNAALDWAGCCPTGGQGVPCPMPTSCVPFESFASCGAACAGNDPHVLVCSMMQYPYCVSVEMRLPSETFWSYGCGVPELTTHLAVDWIMAGGQAVTTAPGGGAPVATTLTTTPTSGLAGGGSTNNQGIGGNGNNYNFGPGSIFNANIGTVELPSFWLLFGFWWFAVFR